MAENIGVTVNNDQVSVNVETEPIEVTIEILEGNAIGGGGSEGVTRFLQLLDTPVTYTGSEEFFVKVNNTGTGLEFVDSEEFLITWDSISDGPNSTPTQIDNTVNKVAGIQAGAEVNVNSDWNAASGDALILNKPIDITDFSLYSTTDLTEGTNLYYTEARVSANTDVTANTTHRTSDGKNHSDVVLNNAHRISSGVDHTYIDQDVTTAATPTFVGLNVSGSNITPTGTQHTQDIGGTSNYFNNAYISTLNLRDSIGGIVGTIYTSTGGNITINPGGTQVSIGNTAGDIVYLGDAVRIYRSGGINYIQSFSSITRDIRFSTSGGGSGTSDKGGNLDIVTGAGGGVSDTNGGDINIQTGAGNGTGTYGDLRLSSGGALTMVKNNETAANVLTVNTSNGLVEYRSASSLGGGIGTKIWW